jgi:hypothetical protein
LVLHKSCKDIGLAVNIRRTKHMEIVRHLVISTNEHITVASNSYKKTVNI